MPATELRLLSSRKHHQAGKVGLDPKVLMLFPLSPLLDRCYLHIQFYSTISKGFSCLLLDPKLCIALSRYHPIFTKQICFEYNRNWDNLGQEGSAFTSNDVRLIFNPDGTLSRVHPLSTRLCGISIYCIRNLRTFLCS